MQVHVRGLGSCKRETRWGSAASRQRSPRLSRRLENVVCRGLLQRTAPRGPGGSMRPTQVCSACAMLSKEKRYLRCQRFKFGRFHGKLLSSGIS